MSVKYSEVIRQAVALINDLAGETVAALETSYGTVPLTNTQLRSPYWTITEIQDAVLAVQGDLVHAIASTPNHSFRASFASRTAALAHRAQLPAVDVNSKPIVGVLGTVYSISGSTVGQRCGEKDVASIERIVASGAYTANQFYFAAIENGRIYHTRATVAIDCCVYAHSDETTNISGAATNMRLPDVLANALICGAAARLCLKQGMYADAAAPLGAAFAGVVTQIQSGIAAVQGIVMPTRKAAA